LAGKTLILARHAKSSWKSDASRDFDRPLNPRGLRNAPQMAQRLARLGPVPEHIVSSPAVRALATARLYATELSLPDSDISTVDALYDASTDDILEVVSELDNVWSSVLLTGHNPGISDATSRLCFRANIEMPTCALACLRLSIDGWHEVYPDCADLAWYEYPKKHQD